MSSGSNWTRRRDPVVGVDLDDVEHLGAEPRPLVAYEKRTRVRARRSPRVAMTDDVTLSAPSSAIARMFAISGIPTVSDAGIHDPTTIVVDDVVGLRCRPWRPSRGPRSTSTGALVHSACRVFQPRRRTAELVEPRERGVEVCLVEELGTADQIAFDRHDVDRSATRRRSPLVRSRRAAWVTTAPTIVQPMHSLDVRC